MPVFQDNRDDYQPERYQPGQVAKWLLLFRELIESRCKPGHSVDRECDCEQKKKNIAGLPPESKEK
jgi:hypothetical protein